MSATILGTRAGVRRKARRALTDPARAIASVNATSDRLELAAHGYGDSDPVQFRIETGPDGVGVLPAPLVERTVYYAKLVADADDLFQVSATPGGAAIDLTTDGTAPFSVFGNADQIIDDALAACSAKIASKNFPLPAAPPYSAEVVYWCEFLAMVSTLRQLDLEVSPEFQAEAAQIEKDLDEVAARGQTPRDAAATSPTNLAVSGKGRVGDRTDTLP